VIEFNKELHAYTNTHTGKAYFSVTSLINQFKIPFDVEKFSKLVAAKEGVSQDEIKKRWNKTKTDACDFGTSAHKKIEDYIDSGGVDFKDDPIVIKFLEICDVNLKKVKNETIVYNNEYRIAGTADLIVDNGSTFDVYDLKTNKNFRLSSKYNNNLLEPLTHFSECEYNIYSLQVSTYAYLYSTMTGKNVGSLRIFWFDKTSETFTRYDTPYLYSDVKNMLETFKNKGFTTKNK
jgi:hypothetical protein